jgi:hypothetical protein
MYSIMGKFLDNLLEGECGQPGETRVKWYINGILTIESRLTCRKLIPSGAHFPPRPIA